MAPISFRKSPTSTIEAKYEVDKAIIQEQNPKLSLTLSGYEKLADQLGKEETLESFIAIIEELHKYNQNKMNNGKSESN